MINYHSYLETIKLSQNSCEDILGQNMEILRFELRFQDSKSYVLTDWTISPYTSSFRASYSETVVGLKITADGRY